MHEAIILLSSETIIIISIATNFSIRNWSNDFRWGIKNRSQWPVYFSKSSESHPGEHDLVMKQNPPWIEISGFFPHDSSVTLKEVPIGNKFTVLGMNAAKKATNDFPKLSVCGSRWERSMKSRGCMATVDTRLWSYTLVTGICGSRQVHSGIIGGEHALLFLFIFPPKGQFWSLTALTVENWVHVFGLQTRPQKWKNWILVEQAPDKGSRDEDFFFNFFLLFLLLMSFVV